MESQVTRAHWIGRILTALIVLFLLFDATIHVLKPPPVVEAFSQLGYPVGVSAVLGIIEFIFIALYLVPRRAFFGAIMLTGYLGGATATHVRVSQPFWFPITVGILTWIALVLRDDQLRAYVFRKG